MMLFNSIVWAARITVINQCSYSISCAVVDNALFAFAKRQAPSFKPVDYSGSTFDARMNLGQVLKCGKSAEVSNTVTQLE